MKLANSNTVQVRPARRQHCSAERRRIYRFTDLQIAQALDIDRVQVACWRERYAQGGIEAIEKDLPRSGRKPKVNAAEIVRLTTQTKPRRTAPQPGLRGYQPKQAHEFSQARMQACENGPRVPLYAYRCWCRIFETARVFQASIRLRPPENRVIRARSMNSSTSIARLRPMPERSR